MHFTHNCRCPNFELPVVEPEMIAAAANITVAILTMFSLMLLAGPLSLKVKDVWSMQLGSIGEGIKSGDLLTK